MNCSVEGGGEVVHGTTVQVGCEMCGCRRGRLHCTRKRRGCMTAPQPGGDRSPRPTPPPSPSEEGTCDSCDSRPLSPSCGPDGRNHRSTCTAVQCAGIPAVEMTDGPCQSQDACEEYPCPGDMLCVNKRGTVACIGPRGCSPDHLRTCVNVTELSCPPVEVVVESTESPSSTASPGEEPSTASPGEASPESEEDAICGSDGETYSSLCQLIQTTNNVRIAHAGPCDSPECLSGEVCGSDGLTYESICELQNQAAVRVDYSGPCVANTTSLNALCQQVLDDEMCSISQDNCQSVVYPEDGCCPICGGSIQIVLDIDAIDDASETNPDLKVVDSFTLQLLEAEVLANITSRCAIIVGFTSGLNVQIIFQRIAAGDEEFCFDSSRMVESFINTGGLNESEEVTTTEVQIVLPQTFSFAIAASASEVVIVEEGGEGEVTDDEDTPTVQSTTEGGAPHFYQSFFSVFLGAIAAGLILMNI